MTAERSVSVNFECLCRIYLLNEATVTANTGYKRAQQPRMEAPKPGVGSHPRCPLLGALIIIVVVCA